MHRFSRCWPCLCATGIPTHKPIPANPKHFEQHPNPISHRVNATTFLVCPTDGHFHHLQPFFVGEENHFRIEAPTLDLLQRKDAVHGSPTECLESALSIFESKFQ